VQNEYIDWYAKKWRSNSNGNHSNRTRLFSGFCYSWGDWEPDTNAIAVPLKLTQGQIYVFNAGGPAFRLSKEFLSSEVAPQLKSIVRNIEATLVSFSAISSLEADIKNLQCGIRFCKFFETRLSSPFQCGTMRSKSTSFTI